MVYVRASLATLLFLAVSDITDAATMSPSFETNLTERIAARKAAIAATPSLEFATYLPEDVMQWRRLSMSQLSLRMRYFQSAVDTLPNLAEQKPADAGAIRQFMNDARDFIVFFDDGVRSGDIMDATSAPPPPPTTRPTPPPTPPSTTRPVPTTTSPPPLFRTKPRAPTTSSDGSSSHDDDSDTVRLPTQRPVTPLPYTRDVPKASDPTPSPVYVSTDKPSTDGRLSTPVIVLLFVFGMLSVFLSILKAFVGSSQEGEDAALAHALQRQEYALYQAECARNEARSLRSQ